MSYHDKYLCGTKRSRFLVMRRGRRAMLRGIRDMSLTPSMPQFQMGSLADDWSAVGNDMRNAMKQLHHSD